MQIMPFTTESTLQWSGRCWLHRHNQHIPCLPKTPKKDRESAPSSISIANTMANWWLCYKPRANKFVCRLRHCANYWIFLETIKNRHLLVDLFDDIFGTEMLRLWRMSIMLENSLILFMYCFVLVNSRPANCDSLMELGQSSTSTNYSRFPEACLKRRNSALKYFGVLRLVLSRRKLSCEQFSSLFSLTTFTTHSSSVETGA